MEGPIWDLKYLDPVVATELGILQLFLSDNDNAVHLII
jgi:hypothetical protein